MARFNQKAIGAMVVLENPFTLPYPVAAQQGRPLCDG